MNKLLILLFLIGNFAIAQTTPDYEKESRWASQVEDALMDGDSLFLMANKHEFMSIYTPSESNTKKTAVIVHGLGAHPDWQQVIQPLRVSLTEQGFNTISIQMPVLKNGAESHEYMPLLNDSDLRLKATLDYLSSEGMEPNLLVAHSLGTVMSTHYLANHEHPFKRFIGIGMPGTNDKYLSDIRIPVLDLYGNQDIPSVLDSVKLRAGAASNNGKYHQLEVEADHFFNDKEDLLIDSVNTWLKSNY